MVKLFSYFISLLQGQNLTLEWPAWCKFLAAFLILTSVLWIPGVAAVKYWNIIPWKHEEPAYFPKEELDRESGSSLELTSSSWRARLFFWMPKVIIVNEVDKGTDSKC